ncbi:MAG: hypothetical protein DWI09_12005 [Planctomycetota bacterium]|nr:MAG: hypothetical protein DWI09_12005 [Planctomycetota bacterium]
MPLGGGNSTMKRFQLQTVLLVAALGASVLAVTGCETTTSKDNPKMTPIRGSATLKPAEFKQGKSYE